MAVNIIDEATFRKKIKKQQGGAYLFFGDEDYLKNYALTLCENLICEDETFRVFNEIKLNAIDFVPSKLTEALMPMPMMSECKLVTLTGIDFNAMKNSEIDEFCEAVANIETYDYNTVIVSVDAGNIEEGYLPKRPSQTLTKLGEYMTLVNFERCSPAKLASWVSKHFEHNKVSASADICAYTVNYCGRDMFNLSSEIDKVSFYVLSDGRNAVTREDIDFVAIPAAEYNAFDFANAILERRSAVALDILAEMKFRKEDPIIIMSEVIGVYHDLLNVKILLESGKSSQEISSALKLHEYKTKIYVKSANNINMEKLKYIVKECVKADSALKLSPKGYSIIENLVCSI